MDDESTSKRLADQIQLAVARDAIRDLVARYNSFGDSGRFEQLMELFSPDAVMELQGEEDSWTAYRGRAEILTIFTGTRGRLSGGSGEARPRYVRHHTATHRVDVTDPDHAEGRVYFQVLMSHGLDHWGRYQDRYVRIEGRWMFAHRRVTTEGYAEASPFAR